MSGPFGSSQWMYKSGDYEIDNSLMLNDNDSEILNWIPNSAGNTKSWTFSCWCKRANMSDTSGSATDMGLFAAYTSATEREVLRFTAADEISHQLITGGSTYQKTSTNKFRDPAAWYHVVLAYDSANGTAAVRRRIYVNGSEVVSSGESNPAQNTDSIISGQNVEHWIGGRRSDDTLTTYIHYDGYLAEINFIDGSTLTPASFGESDSDYGHWKPKKYGGSYGTNGFYLNFKGSDRLMSATGGTITTDGDFKVHSFTSTGNTNFVVSSTTLDYGEADVLVVAGGGAGGYGGSSVAGAGGGAGGLIYRKGYGLTAGTHVVTVGAASTDSTFGTITAKAGGNAAFGNVGAAGGSGAGRAGAGSPAGGTGISGQGYMGGAGTGNVGYNVVSGGGGGGAGAVGGTSSGSGGAGGAGRAIDITGSSVTYATGGAGAAHDGAAGGSSTANTGNGGAGWGGGQNGGGSAGGTGIVIIRYKFQ